jgi:hypothetical protein
MQAGWLRLPCIDMIEANAKAEGDGRILSGYLDEIAHAHGTVAMSAAQRAIVVWLQGAHSIDRGPARPHAARIFELFQSARDLAMG